MAISTRPLAQAAEPCDVEGIRRDIETRLGCLLPDSGNERDLIALAMRESALAPGKRMRPLLMVLAARDLGYRAAPLLDVACAVEMVHAASLVLDDMPCMDNARTRRGRPTLHLHFGEDVAILTAVALLTRAFGVIASVPDVPPLVRAQLVSTLSEAIGPRGLVHGQCQDLREGSQPRSAEAIALTNELKTGMLFAATLEMAALMAQASESERGSLRSFALELGHAFQLYDDLQDLLPNNDKDQGKDIGKSTLLALLGEAEVRARLRAHLARAETHLAAVYQSRQAIRHFCQGIFAKVLKA